MLSHHQEPPYPKKENPDGTRTRCRRPRLHRRFQEGVPYITAEPAITSLELTSSDRFLVLATDGVWEQVSNEEAVRCVSGALGFTDRGAAGSGGRGSFAMSRPQRSTTGRTSAGGVGGGSSATSDALVEYVLARSAQSHGMSVPTLRALPRGPSRRMLHDDMCVTVVHFTPDQSRAPGEDEDCGGRDAGVSEV